jgi:hypothetical protein
MKSFHKALNNGIKPFMKDLGFDLKGLVFVRERKHILDFIAVQQSRDMQKSGFVFTINIAMYLKGLPPTSGTEVDIWTCHWSQRLGLLTPEHTDLWWVIQSAAELGEMAIQIFSLVQEYAIPQLDGMNTPSDFLSYWRSGQSCGLTDGQRLRFLELLEKRHGES